MAVISRFESTLSTGFYFNGSWLVLSLNAEAIGTELCDTEIHQAIVSAEIDELVRAPETTVIVTRACRQDERYVNHPEGGCILEQECEEVALIKYLLTAFVSQRSILFFAYVEVPRIARDGEVVSGGADETKKLVRGDPGTHRAPGQGVGNGTSPGRHCGQAPFALAGLPLDAFDPR